MRSMRGYMTMEALKTALLLNAFALFHPGFAMLIVGLGTIGIVLQHTVVLLEENPRPLRIEIAAERSSPGR